MARYKVVIKKTAISELEAIPKKELSRIMEKIGALADNPRPEGSTKLSGEEKYRLRQGKYRILYAIEDDILTVYVVKAAHRKDVYRR